MADLKLKAVSRTQGNNRALKDGTVKPATCDLEFVEVDPLIDAFRRMVRGLEFDVSEMALTTYITAREHGKRMTALPVFLVRGFHHGAILVNTKSGIRTPKDLEGRRVGVSRGYTVTTGVWGRAILEQQYGVDLRKITWVLSGDEHVAEFEPPGNVVPMEKGRRMADLLASGELPAAINLECDSPDVKPLIAHARDEALKALSEHGLYPINHTIVVKDELLAAHRDLAADLFDTFARSKRLYVDRLRSGGIEKMTPADETYKRVMDATGKDPLPYGVEPNRAVLDNLVTSALGQGILKKPVKVDELFARETLGLVG